MWQMKGKAMKQDCLKGSSVYAWVLWSEHGSNHQNGFVAFAQDCQGDAVSSLTLLCLAGVGEIWRADITQPIVGQVSVLGALELFPAQTYCKTDLALTASLTIELFAAFIALYI